MNVMHEQFGAVCEKQSARTQFNNIVCMHLKCVYVSALRTPLLLLHTSHYPSFQHISNLSIYLSYAFVRFRLEFIQECSFALSDVWSLCCIAACHDSIKIIQQETEKKKKRITKHKIHSWSYRIYVISRMCDLFNFQHNNYQQERETEWNPCTNRIYNSAHHYIGITYSVVDERRMVRFILKGHRLDWNCKNWMHLISSTFLFMASLLWWVQDLQISSLN